MQRKTVAPYPVIEVVMRRSIGAWLFLILLMSGIAGGLGYYKYSEIIAGMAAGASRPEPSDAVATIRVSESEWAPA
jgi:membrane fusion protein (multidrug efflux system)